MYLVRDIFQLKFGAFKETLSLLKQATEQNLMPAAKTRILTDFTGRAYRLIFENQYDSLAAYEKDLSEGMRTKEWQDWYMQFKLHIESSEREIMKIHSLG